LSSEEIRSWQNGDITFQEVIFAYPRRPHQTILRNFSFCFQQGDSYGVAGKNGIGKSTITKTLLKLYGLQSGRILLGEHDIREINTTSLRQKICHQSNRPGFFQLTIAENVFYPEKCRPEDLEKLIRAAKKTGI
jgi:ABC-type multidrug transport system fused ATPase/permease subunit